MYGALRLNGGRWPAGLCAPVSEVGVAGGGAGVSIRAPLSAYGRKWKKTTQPNGDRMEAPKSDTRVPTTGTTVQLYILASRGTRYM